MINVTIAIDEIVNRIKDMGYILATPQRAPIPSFYELDGGTILSALVAVNHLLQDPTNPNDVSINSSISISVYVPPNNRNPRGKQADPDKQVVPSIIDEDVQCDILREEFNVYNLSNNMVMSVKTVAGQIRKTDLYNDRGEPTYNIDWQPVIKFKKR